MRVATLSCKITPQPWTVLALATLVIVFAGASTLDTDRYEMADETQRFNVSIDAQTGNVDENTAAGQTAHTTTVTGTPTACTIGAGNLDQDGDGNKPFSINTACVISVNDAGDLNYEGTGFDTSFQLRVHVNDASSSDWAFVTLSVNDVDEFVAFSLSVQNRRKVRAGLALENHLEEVFREFGVKYARGVRTEKKSKKLNQTQTQYLEI